MKTTPLIHRAIGLSIAALFLGFLVYSTPHRVHHLFDQYRSSTSEHDRHSDRTPAKSASTCVFQVAANRCHVSLIALVPFDAVSIFIDHLFIPLETAGLSYFHPGVFQIRAPPLV